MESLVEKRIEEIETELNLLKKSLSQKKNVKLKGLWKGVRIEEKDFEAAKKSLFESG